MSKRKRYLTFGNNVFAHALPEWHSDQMHLAVDVFMALKTHALLDKLSGGNRPYLDGVELRRAVAPEHRGIASYWLDSVAFTLSLMRKCHLIDELQLNVGRYGYGDDRGFQLSRESHEAIVELGDDRSIQHWLAYRLMHGG